MMRRDRRSARIAASRHDATRFRFVVAHSAHRNAGHKALLKLSRGGNSSLRLQEYLNAATGGRGLPGRTSHPTSFEDMCMDAEKGCEEACRVLRATEKPWVVVARSRLVIDNG
jgi:hypothetical protein